MHIGRITKNALWLLLLPSAAWAASQAINVNYVPDYLWSSNGEGKVTHSPGSTVTFTVENVNWDTLSINAYGLNYRTNPLEQIPSDWQVDLDGETHQYTGSEPLPVMLTLKPNHRYGVTISFPRSSYGMQFVSAVASGPDTFATVPVTSSSQQQTTTRLQEPLMTSSPAASNIVNSSQTRSTVTVFGTSTIAAPNSQASSSTASMQTLGNPYINVPQNSVSLTNPNPSLSTSTENLSTTSQTNYSMIVGAVLGTFAGLALCFLAGFLYYRKRQKQRTPPSMAYMNYRSATEQPPRWNLHRDKTAFMDAAPVMIGGSNRAGVGAGGGGLLGAKRMLSPLEERSMEGSIAGYSPSPYPVQASNVPTTGAVNDRYPSLDSTIDVGMTRTISQPSSAEPAAQAFPASQIRPVSLGNSTAYDGVEPYGGIEVTPYSQRSNPFDDRHV